MKKDWANNIIIIGLGLIGGSLAKALREKAGITRIYGIDPDPETVRHAKAEGVICDGWGSVEELISSPAKKSLIGCSILIFLCTPIEETLRLMDRSELFLEIGGSSYLLTDVCSIKEIIMEKSLSLPESIHFIGGHPMAGSEKSGFGASHSHLFENAYYVLVPGKNATDDECGFLSGLIEKTGAFPLILGPEEHDRSAAAISHVPHVIASALVISSMNVENRDYLLEKLAAGGFKDITRIASSDPRMWEAISLMNRKWVAAQLKAYVRSINDFIFNLEQGNNGWIYGFFSRAKEYRDNFPDAPTGFIPPVFAIEVDVRDKPGEIGKIATLLGMNGINIRNIMVSNSREFEDGCLRITLPDASGALSACKILSEGGYRVAGLGKIWMPDNNRENG